MDGFHGRIKPNGPEHEDLKNEKRFVMTVYFPTRSLTIDLTLLHEPVLQFYQSFEIYCPIREKPESAMFGRIKLSSQQIAT